MATGNSSDYFENWKFAVQLNMLLAISGGPRAASLGLVFPEHMAYRKGLNVCEQPVGCEATFAVKNTTSLIVR